MNRDEADRRLSSALWVLYEEESRFRRSPYPLDMPSGSDGEALQKGLAELRPERDVAAYRYTIALLLAICVFQFAILMRPYISENIGIFLIYLAFVPFIYACIATENLYKLQKKVRCLRLGLQATRVLRRS